MKNFKKKNISVILLNHGEEIVREKFKRTIENELEIDESKIHLFDRRNRFVFSKDGLEKKIPIKENNIEKKEKHKHEETEKIVKRKKNIKKSF